MKLGAKRAEMVKLMESFVSQSRVGVFGNERTRFTPLYPKLMFWCVCSVWVNLGSFHYCTKIDAKRAELVQLLQNFVP